MNHSSSVNNINIKTSQSFNFFLGGGAFKNRRTNCKCRRHFVYCLFTITNKGVNVILSNSFLSALFKNIFVNGLMESVSRKCRK